jgi:hypothetical protein
MDQLPCVHASQLMGCLVLPINSTMGGGRLNFSGEGMRLAQTVQTFAAIWVKMALILCRWRWTDTAVTLPSGKPVPVWALALAGLLPRLQQSQATGFFLTAYHCKHEMAYSSPEPVGILPASMAGLCLASCVSLAFCVLTWLQPKSPDRPIIVKGTTTQTRSNPCGFVFPFGGLQHVHPDQVKASSNGPAHQ